MNLRSVYGGRRLMRSVLLAMGLVGAPVSIAHAGVTVDRSFLNMYARLNQMDYETVFVKNTGDEDVYLSVLNSVDNGFRVRSGCNGYLKAGRSCSITIEFNPRYDRSYSGRIGISAGAAGSTSVQLRGTVQR